MLFLDCFGNSATCWLLSLIIFAEKNMKENYQRIVNKILFFCAVKNIDDPRKAHIGITNDLNRRLKIEHKITAEDYWWTSSEADDAETARAVERHFIEMGMQGGTGGGDNETEFVYCFARKDA